MILGPKSLLTVPTELDTEKMQILEKLLDLHEESFFEHYTHENPLVSIGILAFEIPNVNARGKVERLTLSVIIDGNHKVAPYQSHLEKIVDSIKAIDDVYSALYLGTPQENPDSKPKFEQLKSILENGLKNCEDFERSQKSGNLVFFGLQAVGKSSIIKRLSSGMYDANIRPTLGTQIVRSMLESMQFQIYDLGGQESIRKHWFDRPLSPSAIVYVVDCTRNPDENKLAKYEFDRVVNHYFGKNPMEKIENKTPVLILVNKTDLNQTCEEDFYEKLLKPKNFKINYKIGCVSALLNEGIMENVKWMVQQLLTL